MGPLEIELKEMIINRYGSLAKFASEIDMSWTTLDSILKRGILKANIVNVLKITGELGIDTEKLSEGQIVHIPSHEHTEKPGASYYIDPATAALAQELYARPEMRILFDASKKASADDINFVIDMLERMKK